MADVLPRFVGRARELSILASAVDEALHGHGRLVFISGEPGIGKTRVAQEGAALARDRGALVLWGAAYEGEWAPPYSPFAEALTGYVRMAHPETLRADLGFAAPPFARLVPALRERLPDVSEPAPVSPEEESFRLLDAVDQFLAATARRAPVVLVVDDLHWADVSTVALLRHLARAIAARSMLVISTYRDTELDRAPPLAEALGALRRNTGYVRLALPGLDAEAVGELLQRGGDPPLSEGLIGAIARETRGNPFFALEVLRHLEEETESAAALATTTDLDIGRIGVPIGVRHVVARRVARLSDAAKALLQAAAAADGGFRLPVAADVAGLTDRQALDAVDQALAAQLVAPAGVDSYAFTHALVRHTLYSELNPSRRLRLHRTTAEAMARVYADRVSDHAAEIAEQYHLSAALPGAEAGVDHALTAAALANAAYAHDRVAAFVQLALELMTPNDTRRPRARARLTLARAWALQCEAALALAPDAAQGLADSEGDEAAADFLCALVRSMNGGGFVRGTAELTPLALKYIGERRTLTWVRLKDIDIALREAAAGDGVGIPLDSPERREVRRVFHALRPAYRAETANTPDMPARHVLDFALGGLAGHLFEESGAGTEMRALVGPDDPNQGNALDAGRPLRGHPELRHTYIVGDYRRGLPIWRQWAEQAERTGTIGIAVSNWASTMRFHTALGEFADARRAHQRAVVLAARLNAPSMFTSHLLGAEDEWRMARDEDWDNPRPSTHLGALPGERNGLVQSFYGASTRAAFARVHARVGRVEPALRRLESVIAAIERAPGWAENYVRIACDAAETLWLTRRTDWIETIERNLRGKVVTPDFRYPMMDGRLALARLCALQAHYDEAADWFARARVVLDEQEARPLRAIVDYDEALMYARRAAAGDRERARPLLERALAQFDSIDMPGWIRRARTLLGDHREWTPDMKAAAAGDTASRRSTAASTRRTTVSGPVKLRWDGTLWTLDSVEGTRHLKDIKGLHYLALLLRDPGREFHVLDLVHVESAGERRQWARSESPKTESGNEDLAILDAAAKAAYKGRLTELRDELAEAEAFNDRGRAERARMEIDAISDELSRAVGLGGRDRTTGSAAQRARSAVTKRIKAAIEAMSKVSPALGTHLDGRVRTGVFCVYLPDATSRIEWEL